MRLAVRESRGEETRDRPRSLCTSVWSLSKKGKEKKGLLDVGSVVNEIAETMLGIHFTPGASFLSGKAQMVSESKKALTP